MYRIPHVIRIFLHKSVIFWLVLLLTTKHFTSALRVHVNFTSHKTTEHAVPEELNVTMHAEFGTATHLCLKRIDHVNANIPVYTHNVDKDGRHVYKREQLEDNQSIGYYQDISNEAIIQVARTNGLAEGEAHFILKGELNIAGNKYTLTPGTRVKRDGSQLPQPQTSTLEPSQSFGEPYNLLQQTISAVVLHDYTEAPPEIKRKIVEAANLEAPKLFSVSSLSYKPLSSISPSRSSSKRRRRQLQLAKNYFVDVAAIADYAIYNRFLAVLQSRTDALQAIREYFAFIFVGVNLRYQSIMSTNFVINVRLNKVVITETATAGTFTERFRVSNKPWDEVDAQSVLSAFSEFAAGSGSDMLNPYDHAMLFTGYDLTSTLTTSTNTNATTGLAFTSTLCRTDGKSVSVVEDLGGFQAVDTAAHELGHSLSARHDGDGNTCRSSDRFIMASGSSQVTSSNRYNPWLFSFCSIASFTNFISTNIKTARGQTCLMLPLSISAGVPDVSSRLPGQEFPPDDQCRMIYGSASRLCRGTEFGSSTSVCTSMFCFDPSTAGTCYEQTASMGTTCGDGKLCLNGQCVYDSRAPTVDDDCVFGDQPSNAFDEMTCPDFVNSFSGYCYQALVRGRCCASCKKVYRTVTGCEYGDTVRGCTAKICSFAATTYLEQCCGTCNYGSHFTVPQTTPRVSNITSITHPSGDGLPTTQTTIINIDPGICEDNSNILVNGQTCADAVASNPRFCYQKDVSIACCSSCDEANTGVAGCEYGDKYPSSCSQAQLCESITTECCQTCSTTVKPTNGTLPGLTTPAPISSCIDQRNVLVNNMTCATAIRQFPFYCYTDQVLEACCLACKQKNSGIKGCEYGDHTPQKCQSRLSTEDCQRLGDDCCSTCFSSAHRDTVTVLVSLFMVFCSYIYVSVLSARSTIFL